MKTESPFHILSLDKANIILFHNEVFFQATFREIIYEYYYMLSLHPVHENSRQI
jgi:hypothetical protein